MDITYVKIKFNLMSGSSSRCDCPIVQAVLDAQNYSQSPDLWEQSDFQESEPGIILAVYAIKNPMNGVDILDSPFASEITKDQADSLQAEYFARKPTSPIHNLN